MLQELETQVNSRFNFNSERDITAISQQWPNRNNLLNWKYRVLGFWWVFPNRFGGKWNGWYCELTHVMIKIFVFMFCFIQCFFSFWSGDWIYEYCGKILFCMNFLFGWCTSLYITYVYSASIYPLLCLRKRNQRFVE